MKRRQWVSNLIEITDPIKGLEGKGQKNRKMQNT